GPVRGADDRRRGRPLRPRSPAAVRGLAAAHLQRRIADRQRARAAGAGVGVDAARADAARQSGVRAQRRARARLSEALIRSQRLSNRRARRERRVSLVQRVSLRALRAPRLNRRGEEIEYPERQSYLRSAAVRPLMVAASAFNRIASRPLADPASPSSWV